jgi:hypothetical protein
MKSKKNKWVSLERGNDWGVVYFAYEGKAHKRPWGTSDAKLALKFTQEEHRKIKTADGTIIDAQIEMRSFVSDVYDWGHTYQVSYQLPGVICDFHGVKQWIPLDEFKVLEE